MLLSRGRVLLAAPSELKVSGRSAFLALRSVVILSQYSVHLVQVSLVHMRIVRALMMIIATVARKRQQVSNLGFPRYQHSRASSNSTLVSKQRRLDGRRRAVSFGSSSWYILLRSMQADMLW
jgi:hypothetical protein